VLQLAKRPRLISIKSWPAIDVIDAGQAAAGASETHFLLSLITNSARQKLIDCAPFSHCDCACWKTKKCVRGVVISQIHKSTNLLAIRSELLIKNFSPDDVRRGLSRDNKFIGYQSVVIINLMFLITK